MKTSATNRRILDFISEISSGKLEPTPEFQRRLVWTEKHKNAFLRTIVEGYPFPEIYVAMGEVDLNSGEGKKLLVDGQQRIQTIYQYFTGSRELSLEKDITPYKDLTEEQKRAFLNYEVVVRDLGNIAYNEIIEVFRRINSTNYALNPVEIFNATYTGEFKNFAIELSDNPFFSQHPIFNSRDLKRMGDFELILSALITMLSGYFNRNTEFEIYLEKYNENFPDKVRIEQEFTYVLAVINDCVFDDKCRVWGKADIFTLIVELHRAIFKKNLKIIQTQPIAANLKDFYSVVDRTDPNKEIKTEAEAYYVACRAATNDKKQRILRGQIIEEILTKILTQTV